MGCGASNSSSNQNSGSPPNVSNNGNVRGSNTTPVPVQARANLVSRPLTVTANFRYGATITQVEGIITFFRLVKPLLSLLSVISPSISFVAFNVVASIGCKNNVSY